MTYKNVRERMLLIIKCQSLYDNIAIIYQIEIRDAHYYYYYLILFYQYLFSFYFMYT